MSPFLWELTKKSEWMWSQAGCLYRIYWIPICWGVHLQPIQHSYLFQHACIPPCILKDFLIGHPAQVRWASSRSAQFWAHESSFVRKWAKLEPKMLARFNIRDGLQAQFSFQAELKLDRDRLNSGLDLVFELSSSWLELDSIQGLVSPYPSLKC